MKRPLSYIFIHEKVTLFCLRSIVGVSHFLAMSVEPFYALLLLPIDVNYMIEVVQAIRKQKEQKVFSEALVFPNSLEQLVHYYKKRDSDPSVRPSSFVRLRKTC